MIPAMNPDPDPIVAPGLNNAQSGSWNPSANNKKMMDIFLILLNDKHKYRRIGIKVHTKTALCCRFSGSIRANIAEGIIPAK